MSEIKKRKELKDKKKRKKTSKKQRIQKPSPEPFLGSEYYMGEKSPAYIPTVTLAQLKLDNLPNIAVAIKNKISGSFIYNKEHYDSFQKKLENLLGEDNWLETLPGWIVELQKDFQSQFNELQSQEQQWECLQNKSQEYINQGKTLYTKLDQLNYAVRFLNMSLSYTVRLTPKRKPVKQQQKNKRYKSEPAIIPRISYADKINVPQEVKRSLENILDSLENIIRQRMQQENVSEELNQLTRITELRKSIEKHGFYSTAQVEKFSYQGVIDLINKQRQYVEDKEDSAIPWETPEGDAMEIFSRLNSYCSRVRTIVENVATEEVDFQAGLVSLENTGAVDSYTDDNILPGLYMLGSPSSQAKNLSKFGLTAEKKTNVTQAMRLIEQCEFSGLLKWMKDNHSMAVSNGKDIFSKLLKGQRYPEWQVQNKDIEEVLQRLIANCQNELDIELTYAALDNKNLPNNLEELLQGFATKRLGLYT